MAVTQIKAKVKAKAKAKPKAKVVEGAAKIVPMGAVALRSLTLNNVLSFGAEAKVELGPLNILIGPNGCGKSNLVDVIALLKAAAAADLSSEFEGGAEDWVWDGAKMPQNAPSVMSMASEWKTKDVEYVGGAKLLGHHMQVLVNRETGAYSIARRESIEILKLPRSEQKKVLLPCMILREDVDLPAHVSGREKLDRISMLNSKVSIRPDSSEFDREIRSRPGRIPQADELRKMTLVARRRNALAEMIGDVQIYRGRHVGRGSGALNPLRDAARTDSPNARVSETLENFSMVFNRVYKSCGDDIVKALQEFYEDARDVNFEISARRVNLFLKEKGRRTSSAQRLSDGTLQWLFLLTILLDPKPPALVCIEEPETGLHPDMLPTLARMLIDASKRMQLIVTTHSDMIVDCLTDTPEAVVVCDKVDGVTQMKRLCAEDFHEWKKEGLGMAWISGAIGGKRW